jgi:hypothetical protein
MIDVTTEIVIERPRAQVAAYAADPSNATEWYEQIERVEWQTDPPLALGSRVAFVARFLGRRLAYTYEVVELEADRRLRMKTDDGPFRMETTYTWADAGPDTLMTLRNLGGPSGLARLFDPLARRSVARSTRKDLERLKRILEAKS